MLALATDPRRARARPLHVYCYANKIERPAQTDDRRNVRKDRGYVEDWLRARDQQRSGATVLPPRSIGASAQPRKLSTTHRETLLRVRSGSEGRDYPVPVRADALADTRRAIQGPRGKHFKLVLRTRISTENGSRDQHFRAGP
jgi:hypothetical protein